jgi:hypothetical protein
VLILAYGFMLLQGARLLSDGSELLLEVLDPGIIGGLLLPVLGALPDSLIIIVSGLGGSREEAAEQVLLPCATVQHCCAAAPGQACMPRMASL